MPAAKGLRMRPFWVIAHRWAGLVLAFFLAVAGFTGIFLAWVEELEIATAPEMLLAQPPYPGAPMLDPLDLRDEALKRYPDAHIDFVPLEVEEGRSLRFHLHWEDPVTGEELEAPTGFNDLFINPYTGEELGKREWGNITQGMANLMPFIYRLHYSLALDDWGMIVFGIAATIWVIDCFVGLYLTFPQRQQKPAQAGARPAARRQKGWLQRWGKAWKIRRYTTPYKLNFDLHRAGGLWLWPLLLVFAWSSVSFNLPQVYVPVMNQFGAQDEREILANLALPEPREHPRLTFQQARVRGQELAANLMREEGLSPREEGEQWLWHIPSTGSFVYGFTTSADITSHGGGTRIAFDSNTGQQQAVSIPSGANAANTFGNWLMAMHTAQAFGWWWRVAVSLIGAMVTVLAVTGVVIWLKKRSARAGRSLRRDARQAGGEEAIAA